MDNIKPYDGDSSTLNKFINRCESIFNSYKNLNDAELNQHILESIQEKLIDKAEIMVGNRAELTDWNSLKTALIQSFSDRRDLDCLIQELTRTHPDKHENIIAFGNRLQLLRSNVVQRISNDTTLTRQKKLCHISYIDKTALNTFIAGCSGTLKNNIHIKKPTSLEDAMAYVIEFENFERLYGKCYSDFNKSQKPNFNSPPNSFNNNQQNQFNSRNNHFNHSNNSNNFKPPSNFATCNPYNNNYNNNFGNQQPSQSKFEWKSQPINIQTRNVPPR
ncbi:putative uncharacterized protein DDB_G0279653 [Sitophilus oryzae]|uniref:GATA zinc finger domain-containing protein 14-like n=1 Tax=Sitophilus oryzae TaxID=7048 RepID=A0A6J2YVD5_SITOR|nr:putative uncharacterized protein DDB_G0279653 [Sitophilus oryzae]